MKKGYLMIISFQNLRVVNSTRINHIKNVLSTFQKMARYNLKTLKLYGSGPKALKFTDYAIMIQLSFKNQD